MALISCFAIFASIIGYTAHCEMVSDRMASRATIRCVDAVMASAILITTAIGLFA